MLKNYGKPYTKNSKFCIIIVIRETEEIYPLWKMLSTED